MSYKELIVWQKAMKLVELIYQHIRIFPSEERFRLCDQLSRAAVSVPSNIAEGYGRGTPAEYARFLSVARGSLYEVETQLEIAVRLGFIEDASDSFALIEEIRAMLITMICKLRGGAPCPLPLVPRTSSLVPPHLFFPAKTSPFVIEWEILRILALKNG